VAVHVARQPLGDVGDGTIDLVLGERAVGGGEHEPERETASAVGERPATVDVEQLDGGEQRPRVPADGRLDLARRPDLGDVHGEVALDPGMTGRGASEGHGRLATGQAGHGELRHDDAVRP
jgi:hypothetical protein